MSAENLPIKIQPRDLEILRSLLESRIMTPGHIAILHFENRPDAAKKRLYKLKAAGFIAERRRHVNEPSVLYLTGKAFKILNEQGILEHYPKLSQVSLEKRAKVSEITLRHELAVVDVKAAFHSNVRNNPKFAVEEFTTWPLLNEFQAFRPGYGGSEVLVRPDGFIRIHEGEPDGGVSEHVFYLEVDRSTETQDTLATRAGCYLNFYKSGGFAVKCGASRSEFREYPFRVLFVLKNAERRNNTAERLLQSIPPVLTQVCLSTMDEVKANPLGAIWIRPLDYREATKGTVFDPDTKRPILGYKRQTEREILVEKNVKKISLLG
jgi:hypothetical protein